MFLQPRRRHPDIISRRHEQRSTVITTNLACKQRGNTFPGAGVVVALVDRFAQHCHRVEIVGESYRDKHRLDQAVDEQVTPQAAVNASQSGNWYLRSSMLRNPERDWMRSPRRPVDRHEVERRIGRTSEDLELLSGGLNNINVRVGRDRVLRIYHGLESDTIFRNVAVVGKEAALASRDWRSFRTPKVLARGPDFLVFEFVEHAPISEVHGTAIGRALSEIHATTFAATGLLGANLELKRPTDWGPPDADEFTARDYGHAQLAEVGAILDPELVTRIAAFFDSDPVAARNAADVPVLTPLGLQGEQRSLDDGRSTARPRLGVRVGRVAIRRYRAAAPLASIGNLCARVRGGIR